MTRSEVHLFVLWENSRVAEERILADMAERVTVLAKIEGAWPAGVSAAAGYRRFYGAFLPNADEKVRNAGGGRFLIVVVRDDDAVYGDRETVRGIERVNEKIFDMKWRYREWVGGGHRVHGTNSTEEARRDIMLLTGHPLADWVSGAAKERPMTVLPGQDGWASMAELFAFLNETHPYVVLRNWEGLPTAFDPVHDDVDLLVANAKECAGLLGARKARGGDAAYAVTVGGRDVHLDIRAVGDGYYDEAWQNDILASRVMTEAGVYRPAALDAFHALYHHGVYQKRFLAADYPAKLAALAAEAGIGFDSVDGALEGHERFLAERHYRGTDPKDRSMSVDRTLLDWRRYAREAARICAVTEVRPWGLAVRVRAKGSFTDIRFAAKNADGGTVLVKYVSAHASIVQSEYDAAVRFEKACPRHAVRQLYWHTGRKGAYLVQSLHAGRTLAAALAAGAVDAVLADRLAEAFVEIAEGLKAAEIVHRDIRPEKILLADDGSVLLTGFRYGVRRTKYKKEIPYYRKRAKAVLAPLGGEFVFSPGKWDDAFSLAAILAKLPQTDAVAARVKTLTEISVRIGFLRVRLPASARFQAFFTGVKLFFWSWVANKSRYSIKNSTYRKFLAAVMKK